MLGRTHLAVGVAGALLLGDTNLAGLGAAAVGSLLPDLDQGNSIASKALSPFSRKTGPAGVVFLGAMYWLKALKHNQYMPFAVSGAVILLVLALTTRHRTFTHSIAGMLLATGLVWLALPKLAAPFLLGYALHLAADMLSGKVGLIWPIPLELGVRLTPTGGLIDLAVRLGSIAIIATSLLPSLKKL